MKAYCKLIPLNANFKNSFEELKKALQQEIEKLTEEDNYWGEKPKIEFHENEIIFGYPWVITKAIFKNILENIKEKIKFSCEQKSCRHEFWCEENARDREFALLENEKYLYRNLTFTTEKIAKAIDKRAIDNVVVNQSTLSIVDKNSLASIDEIFKKLFEEENCQGLVIGEEPHGSELARVLLFQVKSYKKYAKVLGLEGFFFKFHQKLLNDYFKSKYEKPPIELIAWSENIDPINDKNFSYVNLLITLKKHKIRPLAIDNFKSWINGLNNNFNNKDRLASMNLYAKEIVEKEIKENECYLLFVGSGHSFNNPYSNSLKQLLPRTKNLVVSEGLKYSPNGIKISEYNVAFNFSEKRRTNANKYSGAELLESDIIFTPITRVSTLL